MNKKTLRDVDLKGKRVVMRVDFNVPLKEGVIKDDTRIKGALPSIKYVLEQGGSLVLMSHLGRPDEKGITADTSLKPVAEYLSKLLGKPVTFVADCGKADAEVAAMKPGDIVMLENTRYYKEEQAKAKQKDGESDEDFKARKAELKEKQKELAKKLASKKVAGKAAKAVAGKAVTGKIKLFIAAGAMAFISFWIQVALLVVIPASVIGSISDLVTGAAEDFQGWLNEVQTSFSETAINAFQAIDDFFDDIYAFFTGDTTEDDIEAQINEVIKYGGRNTAGEETDYGNSINGETAIVYKYFLDEYVDIKRQAEAGNTPAVDAMGRDYH